MPLENLSILIKYETLSLEYLTFRSEFSIVNSFLSFPKTKFVKGYILENLQERSIISFDPIYTNISFGLLLHSDRNKRRSFSNLLHATNFMAFLQSFRKNVFNK